MQPADYETIAEGKYLGLYKRDTWEFSDRPNSKGAVGILAITPAKEIVLVEQFRVPMQARVIEIPAGLTGDIPEHANDSLEQSAARELEEETGYVAGKIKHLISSPTSAGMTSEFTHLYVATQLEKISAGGGVDGEDIVVHVIALDELHNWLSSQQSAGKLIDFKIHAALWQAKQLEII
ncbi:NUDIX hydrolase [Persicirhabdus sediminis]|uniref:GDP-mannose pyrophosphatase n=1 Tax=Persicirhabdus sediminis TaxID=454144 RepID=A0A8J7ME38_9BACT|nr:NUDIX hydrolase [Persicirhabdus sediminis]MBK1790159.1 NUDIX hydrolase [Persicirhabdus sediminis]